MARPAQVCVGVVVGVHGVRGAVRIKSFTADPTAVAAYGPLSDEAGTRRFEVQVLGMSRGTVIAQFAGVGDRDAAEALRGVRLYVPRAALPEANEDEFYHADLIGLPVETREGARLGTVGAVHNFGAGDILEIRGDGSREILLPFTESAVPVVDLQAGRIVADPPAGLLENTARASDDDGTRERDTARGSRRRRGKRESGGGAGL